MSLLIGLYHTSNKYIGKNELHQTLVLLDWVAPNFESVRIDK